jgi:hypothetical protein
MKKLKIFLLNEMLQLTRAETTRNEMQNCFDESGPLP